MFRDVPASVFLVICLFFFKDSFILTRFPRPFQEFVSRLCGTLVRFS